MRYLFGCLVLLSFTFPVLNTYAQSYQPELVFSQNFYPAGNLIRSANGAPGVHYWQNKVDYDLNVSFDTVSHILSGIATIHYYNNSPDNLSFLWLALDQNADKSNSVSHRMKAPQSQYQDSLGFQIESVAIKIGQHWEDANYLIRDTRMQLKLQKALPGNGGHLILKIRYQFKLQERSAAGRAGIVDNPTGDVFELSYWYPRLCVYDDLRGWNSLPFIGGGEFYCEYGDFDYKITVPSGILVVGSGHLLNANEILSDKILNKRAKAQQSNHTVIIRSAKEVKNLCPTRKNTGTTTWHFQMKNTRDVAFACSKSFIWDGAKANLPNGKTTFVQSVYPASSMAIENSWQRATELLKANIEMFSKKWFIYPYPEAVNVAGIVGGMEFPGLTFDWHKASGKTLWLLVSHEIGHNWFPMIVGSNERRYPFMDEGFNTFIDIGAQAKYNNGEFAPKRDGEYAPDGGNPADEIIPVMKGLQNSYTLMDAPDRMDYSHVHPLFYFKTAFGLVLLREVILGPKLFDFAFRTYIRRWAYKHPSPMDFFRTMNNASGEDLTWFWRGWFYHNWLLDQAIESVAYKNKKAEQGAIITISNKEQLVMPILVLIKEVNGQEHRFKLPASVWAHGRKWIFEAPTTSKIVSITLDEKHQLPDIDRKNNVWNAVDIQ